MLVRTPCGCSNPLEITRFRSYTPATVFMLWNRLLLDTEDLLLALHSSSIAHLAPPLHMLDLRPNTSMQKTTIFGMSGKHKNQATEHPLRFTQKDCPALFRGFAAMVASFSISCPLNHKCSSQSKVQERATHGTFTFLTDAPSIHHPHRARQPTKTTEFGNHRLNSM
eukprot:1937027-Amphidinium_carterae.1